MAVVVCACVHMGRVVGGWLLFSLPYQNCPCPPRPPCLPAFCVPPQHPLDEDWYEGITAKLSWTGSTLRRRAA